MSLTNNYDVAYDDLERKIPGGLSNQELGLAQYQGGVTDSAHEIFGFFMLDLYDHRTDSDTTEDAQGFGYEVGYELSFERFSKLFDNFALMVTYHNYKNLIGIGDINIEHREESYKLMFNWYMRHPSGTEGKLLPYAGIGYKRGSADLSHRTFATYYNYSIEAYPVYEVGVKYRFTIDKSNRIGLRAKFAYDRNKLYLRDTPTLLETPRDFVFDDLRFGIGLSYYF